MGGQSAICYANRADDVNPVYQLYVIINQEKLHIAGLHSDAEGIFIAEVESAISCTAGKRYSKFDLIK